jgi:hypothetical protein
MKHYSTMRQAIITGMMEIVKAAECDTHKHAGVNAACGPASHDLVSLWVQASSHFWIRVLLVSGDNGSYFHGLAHHVTTQ